MTKSGTVRRWDAARGFGFIRGQDGGADVFFHVRDYRGAGGAPVEGMAVRFEEIHVGGKGPRAMAVRPLDVPPAREAQQPAPRRSARPTGRLGAVQVTQQRWLPLLMLPVWLGLLVAGVWLNRLPLWALGVLVAVNLLTLFAYAFDKNAAEAGRWRTAERTLHGFALAGGWPAAWFAQQLLRHKSSKASFLRMHTATVLLHCALLTGWVVWLAPRVAAGLP